MFHFSPDRRATQLALFGTVRYSRPPGFNKVFSRSICRVGHREVLEHVPGDDEVEARGHQSGLLDGIGQNVSGDESATPRSAARHVGLHFEADAVITRHRIEEGAAPAAEVQKPASRLHLPHALGQRSEACTRGTSRIAVRVNGFVDTRVFFQGELRACEDEAAITAPDDPTVHRLGAPGEEVGHRVAPAAIERRWIALDKRPPVADETGAYVLHRAANRPISKRRLPKRVARAKRHRTRA